MCAKPVPTVAISAAPRIAGEVPATIQELTAQIMRIVQHHERNCRHCATIALPCVECQHCRMVMEDEILSALRAVNRRR